MLEELMAILIFSGVIGIIFAIRWIIRCPVTPDPWDGIIDKNEFNNNAKPLCSHCSKPIENSKNHYCENCGEIIGAYSRYLPWESIRFNYSICGTMWRKTRDKHISDPIRTLNFILLLLIAPVLIIVAFVVDLLNFHKSKKL